MGKKTAQIFEIVIAALFLLFFAGKIVFDHQLGEVSGMNDYFRRKAAEEKLLPLTIGSLTDYSDGDYSTHINKTSNDKADVRSYTTCTQRVKLTAKLEEGQPKKLVYTVSTGTPEVIDAYMEETLRRMDEEAMDDVSCWRAEEGYRAADGEEHRYLIAWGTRAIDITFGWAPTEEQLDEAVNVLLQ